MKKNQTAERQFVQLSADEMKHLCGGKKITSNVQINFCPVCGAQLGDYKIVGKEYVYICPECGSRVNQPE